MPRAFVTFDQYEVVIRGPFGQPARFRYETSLYSKVSVPRGPLTPGFGLDLRDEDGRRKTISLVP